MKCPFLDAVAGKHKETARAVAEADATPELLKEAVEYLSEILAGEGTQSAAHLDTSNPAHPVIRPDPPAGTSDDDPGSHGASRDDSRDTNI